MMIVLLQTAVLEDELHFWSFKTVILRGGIRWPGVVKGDHIIRGLGEGGVEREDPGDGPMFLLRLTAS